MEKNLQSRIGYFFIGILIVTLLGFNKTYFVKFPTFEGFTSAHHFHGTIALLWLLMLIVQPFLIRAKKYEVHRMVGRVSYFLMPLLLASFFFVSRAGYYRNVNTIGEVEALAKLTDGIPDILFMAILYSLAIIYRKKTPLHMRYFIGTGLMVMGPGLGRYAFITFGPQIAIPILIVSLLLPFIWMIVDLIKKRSYIPMAVYLAIAVSSVLIKQNGHTEWWQTFAKWLASNLF